MTTKSDVDVAADALTMDAGRSQIFLALGTKGRGKSSAMRMLFDAWPYDRLVVDPTGNARPDDPATVPLIAPFPSQMPEPDPDADPPQHRVTVWARIDPGSATLENDQDAAVGMALHPRHRKVLIWRDEFGLGTSAGKMLPNDRTLLMSSRHYEASALLVTQRPRFIPKLAIAQADKIFVWKLPTPEDREEVAKNCGISVPVFERAYHANQKRDRHAFLLVDRENDALIDCPPLPGVVARGPAS